MYYETRIRGSSGFLFLLLGLITPPARSASIRGSPYSERCTSDLDWAGTGFSHEDCTAAVTALYNQDAKGHMGTEVEYLAPHSAPAIHSMPSKKTPLKYRHGE